MFDIEIPPQAIQLIYLVAAVLFVLGIKGMTHPRTAVRGNLLGALAMLLAIVVTLFDRSIISFQWIITGLAIGTIIGAVMAIRIQMTDMPQLVALFNGLGGGASALVAGCALFGNYTTDIHFLIAASLSTLIGALTTSGSIIAFAKLQELMKKNVRFVGQAAANFMITMLCLLLGAWLVWGGGPALPYWLLLVLASLLGVMLVVPIGGADMPVVISLLNSYSGLAAAATGFVINNNVLIVAGSLVGASGIILSRIMCVAMNRSLTNVLFGIMAEVEAGPSADEIYAGKVKSATPDEVSLLFDGARRVLIVPGYGMAAAQAQHVVRDLADLLVSRGIEVEYGIHPVAGRMPGHMNVLLAEADVPYDQLKEMDEVNTTMEQVDVALVIGANDTVNPIARTAKGSPIYGMPILDVDRAKHVFVLKRSMNPGFAGVHNPLFYNDNTMMIFGDAKATVLKMIAAVREFS